MVTTSILPRRGKRGLRLASLIEPDLVLLDLDLRDSDGLATCRQLRRLSTCPIVVLADDNGEQQKVRVLDEGADDYVTKPYSMPELLARVRVALRHHRAIQNLEPEPMIVVGDLQIDTAGRRVRTGDEQPLFTAKEFALLSLLARNAGRILTFETLIGHVWPDATMNRRGSLRVHVNQLRRKLGSGNRRPTIETERGVGYGLGVLRRLVASALGTRWNGRFGGFGLEGRGHRHWASHCRNARSALRRPGLRRCSARFVARPS